MNTCHPRVAVFVGVQVPGHDRDHRRPPAPRPQETQRCVLDITVAPLTFSDWAQGAAVAGIQSVLGAP